MATILVIDDEESVRTVTARALQLFGYEVLTAPDGETGVRTLSAAPGSIACVLLDMTMPGMSGEATLRALRAVQAELPVVLMSGFSEEDAMSHVETGTVSAFLQKPYDLGQLRETMDRITGRAGSRPAG